MPGYTRINPVLYIQKSLLLGRSYGVNFYITTRFQYQWSVEGSLEVPRCGALHQAAIHLLTTSYMQSAREHAHAERRSKASAQDAYQH